MPPHCSWNRRRDRRRQTGRAEWPSARRSGLRALRVYSYLCGSGFARNSRSRSSPISNHPVPNGKVGAASRRPPCPMEPGRGEFNRRPQSGGEYSGAWRVGGSRCGAAGQQRGINPVSATSRRRSPDAQRLADSSRDRRRSCPPERLVGAGLLAIATAAGASFQPLSSREASLPLKKKEQSQSRLVLKLHPDLGKRRDCTCGGRPICTSGSASNARGHLPASRRSSHLRCPALRRHGPRANGRVSNLIPAYEYHFLYITGIDHVESKRHPGCGFDEAGVSRRQQTSSQAMAETVGYVNRARAFMPLGAVPPFITRF